MLEILQKPWPWFVAGPIISLVMLSLLLLGKSFGLSSNLRTTCSILGAGKSCDFFDFNWKDQLWNLVFAGGLVLGGFIAQQWMMPNAAVQIGAETIAELTAYGVENPGADLIPTAIFSWESLSSAKGLVMIVLGGFFVGFGTRYAGGCTSGHAISGLSQLQLPSLIAVIGFFLGGLTVTYFVLPHLLGL